MKSIKRKKLSPWEITKKIKILKELSSKNGTIQECLPLIKLIFNSVTLPGISIKNEFLYRSRWNDEGYLFNHISELKYPPRTGSNSKGRLNDIGESVLYAALCEIGTIIESRPTLGKLFTICKIKCLNPKTFYFPLGVKDKGYYDSPVTANEKVVIDYLNSEIVSEVQSVDGYNSTIALSHFFLKTKILSSKNGVTSGIIYPSVEGSKISNKTTFNVALLPDVFDSYFKIIDASVYCLTNEESHYQLNEVNKVSRIKNDGSIEWSYRFDEMKERISRGFVVDGATFNNIKGLEANI